MKSLLHSFVDVAPAASCLRAGKPMKNQLKDVESREMKQGGNHG